MNPPVVEITPFTELVTPYLPLIGTVVGAIVVGIFAMWNRRRGATENRAPDVNEIWQQQNSQSRELDLERWLRRALEDFVRDLRRAFHSYVRRVQGGGSTDLAPHEQKMFDADPPSMDKTKTH
jgi:hypothetical protein